jgi:hypothetical protein
MKPYESPTDSPFVGEGLGMNPESESLVEAAKTKNDRENADDLDNHVKPPVSERTIYGSKKTSEKRALLRKFVERLDRNGGNQQQYQDCEERVMGLNQRIIAQMRERGSGDDERPSFDGRPMAELLLEEIVGSFSEVTEQDNALEYLEHPEDFRTQYAEAEIEQAGKMLRRLEAEPPNRRTLDLQGDFRKKLTDLSTQGNFPKKCKSELSLARESLQNAHGQEIQDGYNLIPKVSDLYSSLAVAKFGDVRALSVSNAYQKALCSNDMVSVMDVCFETFGSKGVKAGFKAMLELSGADMGSRSQNPSRETSHLVAVRDTLFRTEISSQVFDSSGKLRKDLVDQFPECAWRTFSEREQYEITKRIAQIAQQTFASDGQLDEILTMLGVDMES